MEIEVKEDGWKDIGRGTPGRGRRRHAPMVRFARHGRNHRCHLNMASVQSIPPDDRGCLTVCVSDDGEGDTVALVFGEGVYRVCVHRSSYSINCTLLMKRFGIQHRQKFDVRVETVRGRTALVFDVTKPVPPVRPPSELRSRMATLAYGGTGTEDNDD